MIDILRPARQQIKAIPVFHLYKKARPNERALICFVVFNSLFVSSFRLQFPYRLCRLHHVYFTILSYHWSCILLCLAHLICLPVIRRSCITKPSHRGRWCLVDIISWWSRM